MSRAVVFQSQADATAKFARNLQLREYPLPYRYGLSLDQPWTLTYMIGHDAQG